jgi:uncharacterized protein
MATASPGGRDRRSNVHIRDGERRDWPAILAINAGGAPGVTLLGRRELARMADQGARLHVAVVEGDVIGYLIAFEASAAYEGEEFRWFRQRMGHFLYVDQIAVAEHGRGAGIGAALYGDAIRSAERAGLDAIACEINLRPANPVSLCFHSRLGFDEVGTLSTRDGRLVSLQLLEPGGEQRLAPTEPRHGRGV